jgi:hypothetical protein
MPSPLDEFAAQIDGLRADMEFVRVASQLRPRIGPILQWQARGVETELAKRFIKAAPSRIEDVYGPLLVRLFACLERYLRKAITSAVISKVMLAESYDDLPGTLRDRNIILTGRLLAALDNPREYLILNISEMIENLASCKTGSSRFKLNSDAFAATVSSANPQVIEKALENIDVSNWWDKIGASQTVVGQLGTKGNRATGLRAKERLGELTRWRNHVAHGGDGQITISDSQLSEAVDFIAAFATALDKIVQG